MTFQYNFKHTCRGQALIIGNEFKGWGRSRRWGCAEDLKMMDDLFKRLDFKMIIFKNLGIDAMKDELQKAATSSLNKKSDCFVLVISSHGEEILDNTAQGLPKAADVWKHAVLADDGGKILVEDIVDMFTDAKAPGLKDKPKLFYIQACRSRGSGNRLISISHPKFDQGHTIKLLSTFKKIKRFFSTIHRKIKPKTKDQIYTDIDVTDEYETLIKDLTEKGELKGKNGNPTGKARNEKNTESDNDGYSTEEYSEEDDVILDDSDENNSDDEDASKVEQTTSTPKETDEQDASKVEQTTSTPKETDEQDASKVEQTTETAKAADEQDAPPGTNQSSPMPTTPFDVVPINCPNDFLIMYPVMPGKVAFRFPLGSYIIQKLHKGENASQLFKGDNILQYLTSVSQDMAKFEYFPDLIMKSASQQDRLTELQSLMESNIKPFSGNKDLLMRVLGDNHKTIIKGYDESLLQTYLESTSFSEEEMQKVLSCFLPFKVTACLVHRLRDNVIFRPKSGTSPMAKKIKSSP